MKQFYYILTATIIGCSMPVHKDSQNPAFFISDSTARLVDDTSGVSTSYSSIDFDNPPVVIHKVQPDYPTEALRRGIEADVSVRILLTAKGITRRAEIAATNNRDFNRAALAAAMQWTFVAAKKNGTPIDTWIIIPFRFRVPVTIIEYEFNPVENVVRTRVAGEIDKYPPFAYSFWIYTPDNYREEISIEGIAITFTRGKPEAPWTFHLRGSMKSTFSSILLEIQIPEFNAKNEITGYSPFKYNGMYKKIVGQSQ